MAKTPKLLILFFLMLITLSISVSASISWSETPYNSQVGVTHAVLYDTQNIFWSGTNACIYDTPKNWSFDEPSSRVTCGSVGSFQNVALVEVSSTLGKAVMYKTDYSQDRFNIRNVNWGGTTATGYWSDWLPSSYVLGSSKIITYNTNNDEIVVLSEDKILYFLTMSDGVSPEYVDFSYIYQVTLEDSPNITGSKMLYDGSYIYLLLSDDTIQIYDVLGFLVDTWEIPLTPSISNAVGIWFQDNKLMISDSGDYDIHAYDYEVGDTPINNTFTVAGNIYSKGLCITENLYCSNTSYVLSGSTVLFSCPTIAETNTCSDECVNTQDSTTGVISGSCEQLGCTNECNVLGSTSCTSGSTYATCGNFDSDACLEFGSVLNCPANQYCSDEEVGSQCSTLTSDTLYNQDFLSVDLDLQSQSGVIKEEGTSEKTKNIAEIGLGYVMALYPPSYLLGFDNVKTYVLESFYKDQINETYVMSSFEGTGASTNYYTYNCDYEQNYFLSDNLEHNDLNSNGWEGSGVINTTEQFNFIETTGTINKTIQEKTNSETDVIIELLETGTYNVKYYNDENLLLDFEIVNNKTNFNIVVTEKQNNKLLLNSTSTSDDLQEIFIRTSFINDVEAGNNFISLIRNVLNQDINENYFSLPLGVGNSLNPNKIVFESNTNQLWIYEVIGSSIKDYPVYTNDEESIKNFECQHTQAECYIVRAYGNTQGMSTYYFYEEIQTCIQSLNGVVSVTTPDVVTTDERSTIEKALNKNWNTKQKLLFAVITLIIVFGLFGALTMADGDKTFMLIGTILTGVLMFYFIIDGFIPAWVIVLFGIVGAFISASAIRNMSTGA